jgi:acetyl-CoA carboxylase carboxyl transferase subunit beta
VAGAEDHGRGAIEILTDEGSWELWATLRSEDPLNFEHYADRLANALKKAGPSDAIFVGTARLDGVPFNLGVMNFAFMGGSMGSVVGEKITRLARRSTEKKIPLVRVRPVAPGCRRNLSSQMSNLRRARPAFRATIPFVTILTDPATGGVGIVRHAGDVILAGPGALIDSRAAVIKQTIGRTSRRLPDR